MKRYILIALILFVAVVVFGEVSGGNGWQMLKMVTGTTASAQAGTGVFSNDYDAFMTWVNPASSALIRRKILTVGYNYWLMDTNVSNIAYISSTGKIGTGVSFKYLDYGKLDRKDEVGDDIGEFHPLDMVISSNFSYRIAPNQYVGTNLSLLYEKIDTASSYGISADLGYFYMTPIKGLKFSATLKHFGLTSKMGDESIKLPLTADFSIIKDYKIVSVPVSSEIKIKKYFDDDAIKVNLGLNAVFHKIFILRTGYKINYSSQNISAGFGINIRNIKLDYAFIPFDSDLGDVHQIGITYVF